MWDLSPTSPADEDDGHPGDGYLEWWLRRVADGDPPQEPSESSSTEDRAVILAEQAENDALLESIAAAEAEAEDALKQAALRERQEAEAVRRAKRAEARAMEAARREAAAQAAARAEAERQAAMEREIQRRVEECVNQKVQEAQREVLQVPNVFVLLGRLEQALQRTQEQEEKRLELLATMTMLLQNLQEEQQELRKVQATTLDIIGQQIGRSMPSSAAPKRQPPRVRCGTCDACTQDCRPGARRPNCALWGSAPGTPATSAPSTPARKRGPDGKFIGEGGRVLSPQREKDMAKSILAEQAARAKRKKPSPSPTRGPALGGDKNRPGDGSGDGGEAMAEAARCFL